MARISRLQAAVLAPLLFAAVVLIFPLYAVPEFAHDDAVAHLLAGTAVALALSVALPDRDDLILAAVFAIGLLWEPAEWYYFDCILGSCTLDRLSVWMLREDTLFDITLVTMGGVLALLALRRYR